MSTLSRQVCRECNKFNCIYVDTVDTCIFTCSFYTDLLKKSRTGNSRDTMAIPPLHQSFQMSIMKVVQLSSAQWDGPRVLSRLSMKQQKTTWWAWWRMPTCWPFMHGEWLSSPGISSLHVEYGESPTGWT